MKKKSSNLIYRTEAPTTTICFAPFLKTSVLQKYNVTYNDFLFRSETFVNNVGNISWTELQNELFYQINVDFRLSIQLLYDPPQWLSGMVEGYNGQSNNETNAFLTKIITFFNGICYKITFDFKTFKRDPRFWLKFNVSDQDVPKLVLLITSEENAQGATFKHWLNGKALKIIPEHIQSYFRYLIYYQNMYIMCRFKNFHTTQIFGKINFGDFRVSNFQVTGKNEVISPRNNSLQRRLH